MQLGHSGGGTQLLCASVSVSANRNTHFPQLTFWKYTGKAKYENVSQAHWNSFCDRSALHHFQIIDKYTLLAFNSSPLVPWKGREAYQSMRVLEAPSEAKHSSTLTLQMMTLRPERGRVAGRTRAVSSRTRVRTQLI